MGYTVITGACGGLGRAFAELLAERKEKLILTGRSEVRLQELCEDLSSRCGIQPIVFAMDLTDLSSRKAFEEFLSKNGYAVERLINVAGADIQKGFAEYSQEKIAFQARVNFEGPVSLCRIAIECKDEEKTLEIINVSSVSGIYPMPYFAIYSATKRALWSFSVALREEGRRQGWKVTAVLPGAMPTREDVKAQIRGQGLWGKLAAKSPKFVAQKSLKAVAKNKRTCIPGFANKCMNFGTKLIPLSWKLKFIAKRWSKISKDAF